MVWLPELVAAKIVDQNIIVIYVWSGPMYLLIYSVSLYNNSYFIESLASYKRFHLILVTAL